MLVQNTENISQGTPAGPGYLLCSPGCARPPGGAWQLVALHDCLLKEYNKASSSAHRGFL